MGAPAAAKNRDKNRTGHRTAMSARLLELSAETNDPQPYLVTDDITVTPPTRTQRKAMNTAELEIFFLTQLRSKTLAGTMGVPPQPPADDASDEERTEYALAQAKWQLKADQARISLENINEKLADAHRDFEKAFFGDAYEDVIDFFEDKPLLWDKFIPDIRGEFLPPAPDNGVCPTCGSVDEDAAGKVTSPST